MTNLVDNLIEVAQKKHDTNGNPVYKISIQTLIDEGYRLSSIKSSAKPLGIRLVKNDSQIILQSYNLREDLSSFIKNINSIEASGA